MTFISITDPLALVAIAAGKVGTPSTQEAAAAAGNLDTQQRAVQIGEPVPIVFARRVGNAGGILISPGATEARFTNNATTNAVTAYYHLVLSEGQMDSIPVKDVFQRSCRVGSHTQTYNRRAGTWTPGNAITEVAGKTKPECPYYCGSVGSYPDMTTLSFTTGAIPDGFDYWNRQVHIFVRGGMWVTRLEDNILGPSNSFADLTKWLMVNSSRLPLDIIDNDALTSADLFLRTNGFTCNCEIKESINYEDLMAKWGPYFLLGSSSANGKKGLRPVLPTLASGAINTGKITPSFTFNEDTVMPGTFEVSYTSLADRLPFAAQVMWRQELGDDFGFIRTAEVRFARTAVNGPYESHDLSAFCTSERHAAKIGAYIVAKRVYTTHTARLTARPGAHTTTITPGDIVRVQLDRIASGFEPGAHDYLYQVERITKTLAGDTGYELTHFPIDTLGRSLVALAVNEAQGSGILLTSNRTGITCDVNADDDDTIPAEEYTSGTYDDQADELTGLIEGGVGAGEGYVPGQLVTPSDVIPEEGGGGSGGGGCTYSYTITKKCSPDGPPVTQNVPDGGGYIISSEDPNCAIFLTQVKKCPGKEPQTTTQELFIDQGYSDTIQLPNGGTVCVTFQQYQTETTLKHCGTETEFKSSSFRSDNVTICRNCYAYSARSVVGTTYAQCGDSSLNFSGVPIPAITFYDKNGNLITEVTQSDGGSVYGTVEGQFVAGIDIISVTVDGTPV